MADNSGDFIKNISNFNMMSPIQPPVTDELRSAPVNAYEHNLNLTFELQKLVNEHLMMERDLP